VGHIHTDTWGIGTAQSAKNLSLRANQCAFKDFNFARVSQVNEFFGYFGEFWDIENLLSYIGYRSDLIKFELDCLDGSEEIK